MENQAYNAVLGMEPVVNVNPAFMLFSCKLLYIVRVCYIYILFS